MEPYPAFDEAGAFPARHCTNKPGCSAPWVTAATACGSFYTTLPRPTAKLYRNLVEHYL